MKPINGRFAETRLETLDPEGPEIQYLDHVRAGLTNDLGGELSFMQQMMVEHAAIIQLRLWLYATRIVGIEKITSTDQGYIVAWINAHGRILKALGLRPNSSAVRPKPDHTLQGIMQEMGINAAPLP